MPTRRLQVCLAVCTLFPVAAIAQNPPAAAAAQPPAQQAAAAPTPAPNDYSRDENWLCRPGRQDACNVDLSTTVIPATGKPTREDWAPAPDAPVDCFYVYPTVSTQASDSSDMTQDPEERHVVAAQFARFASVCRPYAPMYRQVTMPGLVAALSGRSVQFARVLAFQDVLDAWRYYLDHDNHGRGVVLIGHSQGAGILTRLIQLEIDAKPAQSLIVSALLIGTSLPVPRGADVGGGFQHLPLCHAASQTGCVITYASFRVAAPPTPTSLFGHVSGDKMMSACTNPAALAGGTGELHAYLPARSGAVWAGDAQPAHWTTSELPIETHFVSLPGMLSAACVDDAHGSYLAISVHTPPGDQRTGQIPGDVVVGGNVLPDWGLHLIDVNLAQGNLIDIVGRQAKAWQTATHAPGIH
jgi:hypothetical protein